MTSEEIKEAIQTIEKRRRDRTCIDARGQYETDYVDAASTLADAYIARLAADEQQAKVDAEPIGREWFNENGNDVSSIIVCRDNIEYEIEAACGNPSIGIDLTVNDRYACKIIHIPHVTTRGQLRKLLEALKGGA